MKKQISLLITIGGFAIPSLMFSCSEKKDANLSMESSRMMEEKSSGGTYANSQDQEQQTKDGKTLKQDKKLIRKGNLTIESKVGNEIRDYQLRTVGSLVFLLNKIQLDQFL